MTGRSLHDALLRVLTDAELRRRVLRGAPGAVKTLGAEEAATLRRADPERLRRMARFMARHFYRERIVRLFRYSRALLASAGLDPLDVMESAAFSAVLDCAVLGSPASADAVAKLVEQRLLPDLADRPYGRDLVTYEGTMFRVEAGPRRWLAGDGNRQGVPARSPSARLVELAWDLTPLLAALRRGDSSPAQPLREPTRLLVALSPRGRVTAVRCPDVVSRLLDALDGRRRAAEAAAAVGMDERDTTALLAQLTDLGAVEWRPEP